MLTVDEEGALAEEDEALVEEIKNALDLGPTCCPHPVQPANYLHAP